MIFPSKAQKSPSESAEPSPLNGSWLNWQACGSPQGIHRRRIQRYAMDPPALEELRRDVKTNLFDAVYFLDTDRIARDVAYQTIILGELLR